jgi:hypothetical protein
MFVIARLEKAFGGLSQLQIQKLAFLSCILSMYEGHPAAEWGYTFATTEFGKPICVEISSVLLYFTGTGVLAVTGGRHHLSESGRGLLSILKDQQNLTGRDRYLSAACESALATSPGSFNRGIDNEPTLASSDLRARGAMLLSGPSVELLHEHFGGLTQLLPNPGTDLLSPSLVWLAFVGDASSAEPMQEAGIA